MSNRELLEAAARAAGIKTPVSEIDPIGRQYVDSLGLWAGFAWGWEWWHPLENDSHALRLAGKLRLSVVHSTCGAAMCMSHDGSVNITERPGTGYGEDHYAATRRAIVKAAAALAGTGGA